MKKILFLKPYVLFYLFIFLAAFLPIANAQVNECGTPPFPDGLINSILEQQSNNAQPAGLGPVPTVAIWLYLLRGSNGETNHSIAEYQGYVSEINSYFENVVKFTLCGSTIIDNDNFRDLDIPSEYEGSTGLLQYVNNTLNEPSSTHCVRVFVCDVLKVNGTVLTGTTYSPLDPTLNPLNPAIFVYEGGKKALAHEMGHYFGLDHTFKDASNQYVNSPVLINGDSLDCQHTGDGICDTPADPGTDFCTENPPSCTEAICTGSHQFDPLGIPYHPDPTLLMSYYGDCRNRFSEGQKTRMITLLDGSNAFGFLFTAPTECLLPIGKINRFCDILPLNDQVKPMPYDIVGINDVVGNPASICYTPTGQVGEYSSYSCSFTYPRRIIIPDTSYGLVYDGVGTFDMVLISKHILGIEPLGSPYLMIAADVNNSGSITTFDNIFIRKVLLGISNYFPAGNWRYISEAWANDQSFIDMFDDGNPFDATTNDPFNGFERGYHPINNNFNDSWMDYMSLPVNNPIGLTEPFWSFYGIKVGDVNCSNEIEPSFNDNTDFYLSHSDNFNYTLTNGNTKRFKIVGNSPKRVSSWQFAIKYPTSNLEISNPFSGDVENNFDPDNFSKKESTINGQNTRILRSIWFSEDGHTIDIDKKSLFEFEVTAKSNINHLDSLFKIDPNQLKFAFYDSLGDEINDVVLYLIPDTSAISNNDRTKLPEYLGSEIKVWPNSFNSSISFLLNLNVDDLAEVRLFDSMGKLVATDKQYFLKGENEIILSDLAPLPRGWYFYNVRIGDKIQNGKLIKQ